MNFTEGDERLGWLVNVSSVSAPNARYDRSRGIGAASKDENASIHTRYARRYPPARSPSRAPIQNLSKAWHPALSVFQNSRETHLPNPSHPRDPDHGSGGGDRQGVQRRQLLLHAAGRRHVQGSGPVRALLPHRHQAQLRARRRGVSPPPVRGQDPRRHRARQGGPGPQEPPERAEAEVPQGDVRDGAGPDGRPPRGVAHGEKEPIQVRSRGGVRGAAPDGGERGDSPGSRAPRRRAAASKSPPRARGPSPTTRTP